MADLNDYNILNNLMYSNNRGVAWFSDSLSNLTKIDQITMYSSTVIVCVPYNIGKSKL